MNFFILLKPMQIYLFATTGFFHFSCQNRIIRKISLNRFLFIVSEKDSDLHLFHTYESFKFFVLYVPRLYKITINAFVSTNNRIQLLSRIRYTFAFMQIFMFHNFITEYHSNATLWYIILRIRHWSWYFENIQYSFRYWAFSLSSLHNAINKYFSFRSVIS